MNLDDLTIGQLKEIKQMSACSTRPKSEKELGIQIVILQRGWVAVGYLNKTGQDCVLSDAHIVRIWGTSKGLGEIALAGPTDKTVLDKVGTMRFHELTIVAMLECEERKWKAKLA